MITAMSVADTVMIAILTMTGSWCADARSVRITERMDGMSNKQKCKLRPTYNSLQKTTEKVVHDLKKAFGIDD